MALNCKKCDARCCRYIAIGISRPKSEEEYENIFWYLLHKKVRVFIDKKEWYIQFNSNCKKLKGNRCSSYEDRPKVCRELKIESCEYHGEGLPYEIMFKDHKDFIRYAKEKKFKWKRLKTEKV